MLSYSKQLEIDLGFQWCQRFSLDTGAIWISVYTSSKALDLFIQSMNVLESKMKTEFAKVGLR